MDDNWTTKNGEQVERVQATWDSLLAGDFAAALDSNNEDVIFENGPGAGRSGSSS